MIYAIFILFFVYTACCCLDGHDLKPIWKKWLGRKLYNKAVDFYPQIKNVFAPTFEAPKIEYYNLEPIRLKCNIGINKMQFIHLNDDTQKIVMENAKRKCILNLTQKIINSNFIDFKFIQNPYNRTISVESELKILKKN
jgi:hypothetical protein